MIYDGQRGFSFWLSCVEFETKPIGYIEYKILSIIVYNKTNH